MKYDMDHDTRHDEPPVYDFILGDAVRNLRRKAKRHGYHLVLRRILFAGEANIDFNKSMMLVDGQTRRAVLDGRFDLSMCEVDTFLNQMTTIH